MNDQLDNIDPKAKGAQIATVMPSFIKKRKYR